jgi:hypothetical protein
MLMNNTASRDLIDFRPPDPMQPSSSFSSSCLVRFSFNCDCKDADEDEGATTGS